MMAKSTKSIEDKISLFTKVIIERLEDDYKRKQSKIVEYYENRKKETINKYEEREKKAVEKAVKVAKTKKQQLILKTKSDLRLSILKKRQEFSERVTNDVKKRIISFVDTDEYITFLVKSIEQALSAFNKDQFIIFNFNKNDVEKKHGIILKTISFYRNKDTYQINILDSLMGGVSVKTGDGRMEIDFSINTILKESDKLIGKILTSRLNKGVL